MGGTSMQLWGYYKGPPPVWIPLQVDVNGFVKVDMSEISLDDLGDVSVPAPADGDFFYWDAAASLWKSKAHAALTTGIHAFDKSCRAYHNADQIIPDAAATYLAFNSERWDTDAIHDLITNNSRLTCQTAGKYIIVFNAAFELNATGYRSWYIWLNRTTRIGLATFDASVGSWSGAVVTTIYDLIVGDYVEAAVYQNSGGNLLLKYSPTFTPEFMMARIA